MYTIILNILAGFSSAIIIGETLFDSQKGFIVWLIFTIIAFVIGSKLDSIK